jgi:hypothetical protein
MRTAVATIVGVELAASLEPVWGLDVSHPVYLSYENTDSAPG